MRVVTIPDGYKYWHPKLICTVIELVCYNKYKMSSIVALNRLQTSLLFEFYLHNICYYVTKPFIGKIKFMRELNLRSKNVDLEQKTKLKRRRP